VDVCTIMFSQSPKNSEKMAKFSSVTCIYKKETFTE